MTSASETHLTERWPWAYKAAKPLIIPAATHKQTQARTKEHPLVKNFWSSIPVFKQEQLLICFILSNYFYHTLFLGNAVA
jgi:hypothetical protein